MGQSIGPGGAIRVTPELAAAAYESRREQHVAQHEEEIAFAKVTLLDRDQRRIARTEEIRRIVPFVENSDGDPSQSVDDFFRRWDEQGAALGQLAHDVNRSLELERYASFRWDGYERRKADREAALHARLTLDKKGKRLERGGTKERSAYRRRVAALEDAGEDFARLEASVEYVGGDTYRIAVHNAGTQTVRDIQVSVPDLAWFNPVRWTSGEVAIAELRPRETAAAPFMQSRELGIPRPMIRAEVRGVGEKGGEVGTSVLVDPHAL